MSMVVQHNVEAIDAYNATMKNVSGVKKASEKLASGQRINRASDDAAGLAISQKVGSQITGLNQAVRNSQDGINMVAVYEGAAAESQEVLIRMKELAMQAANGTYDDHVDREALEHEFMHMNDELNQLSDTDFNGIVALNGGIMADGTMAMPKDSEQGMFRFENWWEKLKYNTPVDLGARYDVSFTPPAADNSEYLKGTYWKKNEHGAGMLWDKAKDECQNAITNGTDTTELTIIYKVSETDEDGKPLSWKGYYMDGKTDEDGNPGVTAYGGNIRTDSTGSFIDELTNLKMGVDLIHGKTGDFVAVKYTKPYPDPAPPTSSDLNNITVENISGSPVLKGNYSSKVKLELSTDDPNITDMNSWTPEMFDVVKQLDGARFSIHFPKSDLDVIGITESTDLNYELIGSDGKSIMPDGTKLTQEIGGIYMPATFKSGEWEISLNDKPYPPPVIINIKYDNVNVASFTQALEGEDINQAIGEDVATMTFMFKGYVGFSDQEPTAEIVNIDPMFAPVSIPNYYEHSNTHMSYTENITLQGGARTKDAVNFTFSYTKGADPILGDLQSNIDISARVGGLNTENLTLLNQADANKAVDGIDAALNKVSMIRATFGAMQNRLDHKISNMTSTSENLTASRSYIQDTDMASEAIGFTKFTLLQQAAQSVLSQANQSPQSLLQLLGNVGSGN